MKKLILAAAVAGLSVTATPAKADAIAYSSLELTGFSLMVGDGAIGGGSLLLPLLTGLQGNNSGDTSASLFGAPATTATANPTLNLADPFSGSLNLTSSQGAGYVVGNTLSGAPVSNYAGSHADVSGNALLGGTSSLTENAVSLVSTGVGSSQSNTGVQAQATFTLTPTNNTPVALQVAFNAEAFLRAYVGLPSGNAQASYNWTITLRNAAGALLFRWAPDGLLGSGITGGTEFSDAFNMNDTISAFGGSDFSTGAQNGYFEAETLTLAGGTYTLSVRQSSSADATFVPEPGSLALIGLGLLGFGAARRRKPE